jgi:MinD superfamily P-loop ATPase
VIISIASGKGGTGKTTVATNLAVAVGRSVQLLDCDVEEPNAHLFLNPKITEKYEVTTPVPLIGEQKCTYCGKCKEICQFKAIAVVGKSIMTFPELCHSCGGCRLVCPEDAITDHARPLGIIEMGNRNGLEFIHGKLRIGEAMSPPLIKKVRSVARQNLVTIIDAPPGTSCPVIASIKHTDFVLLVTEPTPFGLHDLVLTMGAVKKMGIPCGLVINRAGLGDNLVHQYAQREHLPVLLEIPFERRIAEAYSRGKLIIDTMPEWKNRFKELYQGIIDICRN